jgi:predicted permease
MGGVLSVTAPVYLLIAVGFLATRFGLFERADMRVFGKYTINLALPALLFNALSQRQVGEILNPVFIAAYLGGSLLVMLTGIAWARRVAGKDVPLSAVIGMGMACPNSGFIGFPLVAQVFGAGVGGVALALAMIVENLLLIPIALAIAASAGGEGASGSRLARWRAAVGQSLRTVARNPMIHGLALGFLFSLFGWRLPEPLARAVGLLAVSCSAIALFVIGGSLVGQSIRGVWRDVSLIVVGKLLLHPLAVLLLVMLLPPMPRELQVTVVIMAAVPQMGIYPILAQRFGHDGLAASAQLASTVVSFFTLTALLWVLAPPL